MASKVLDREGVVSLWKHISDIFARKTELPTQDVEKLKSDYAKIADGLTPDSINESIKDVQVMVSGDVTAENINSAAAWYNSLDKNNITVEKITATTGYIDDLISNSVTADVVKSTAAYITYLTTNTIKAQDIVTDHAAVENLDATYARVVDLTAAQADISSLKTDKLDAKTATATYATIKNLDAANANITDLQTNKLSVDDATAKYATIDNLNSSNARISTLETDTLTAKDAKATYATIDNLNASNARITTLETDTLKTKDADIKYATIDNLNAAAGRIATLEADDVSITGRVTANEGSIKKLDTSKLSAEDAKITYATIDNLTASNARITTLETSKLSAGDAELKYATIDSLNAANAKIDTLDANKLSADDAKLTYATIKSLDATNANIDTLNTSKLSADDAKLTYATIKSLDAANASITDLQANKANITDLNTAKANIADLQSNKADIDMLNVKDGAITTAKIANGAITTALIDKEAVTTSQIADGSITDAKIDSLSASKLTAGKIDASDIEVVNLNAANITVGKINGQQIANGAITTDNLSDSLNTTISKNTTDVTNALNDIGVLQKTTSDTNQNLSDYKTATDKTLADLQTQIDGQIEAWYEDTDPSDTTVPTKDWSTDTVKKNHVGDVYYNTSTGHSWRYIQNTDGTFEWKAIPDSDASEALALAKQAQQAADTKKRIFVSTPTPPYDIGDLWVQGSTGDILKCKSSKASGNYSDADWEKASKYTDDTKANEAKTAADNASSKAEQAIANASNALTTANGKNKVFHQITAPTSGMAIDDIWFDTDDGYQMYRYSGTKWVVEQFGESAIADASIGNAKIKDASIDDAKISTLDAGKITTGTIAADRIGANTITGDKIAAKTITATNMAADSIAAGNIQSNAVTADKIATNAISAKHINADTITGDKLVEDAITTREIAAKAVTANEIAANAVTADKISVSDISAIGATIGGLTIESGSIHTTAKNKIDSTETGLFIDSAGQMNVGSKTDYVKFQTTGLDIQTTGTFHIGNAGSYVDYNGEALSVIADSMQISGNAVATQSYADTKASAAKDSAVSAAASDATTKANKAKSDAISTAASDATTKADKAKSDAIATANANADSKISSYDTNLNQTKVFDKLTAQTDTTSDNGQGLYITDGKVYVNATNIKTGTLSADRIATESIGSDKLAANSVTANKIAADAIKSRNYTASTNTDSLYSSTGSFFNLTNGNIYTPNFGVDSVNGKAYINGDINAQSGHIGVTGDGNYWELGTQTDYNTKSSAALIGHGTSYIQSGKWQISNDRINTQEYDNERKITYPKLNSRYYDYGMQVPELDSTKSSFIKGVSDNWLYIRYHDSTIPTIESDWKYLFRVDKDGNIYEGGTALSKKYASIDGVSGAYLPLTGGTITGNLTVNGTLSATADKAKQLLNAITINGKTYNGSTAVDVGVIDVSHGGTGATNAKDARVNLGLGNVDNVKTLPLSGGTMINSSDIIWADSGNKANNNTGITFPVSIGQLKWNGQGKIISVGAYEDAANSEKLVIGFSDNSQKLTIQDSSGNDVIKLFANGGIDAKTINRNGYSLDTIYADKSSATSSHTGLMASTDKAKLDGIETGAQKNTVTSVSGRTGTIVLTKTDVGLGNVANVAALPLTGGTITGSVTANSFQTGTNGNNYFQCRKFRGEGDASNYYHAIDFGYSGHNQVDFYEFGAIWNFYRDTTGTKDGASLVGSITGKGWTGKVNGFTVGTNVPADAKFTDTTYVNATTSASGLMSKDDKSKLDSIKVDEINGSLQASGIVGADGISVTLNDSKQYVISDTHKVPTTSGTSGQIIVSDGTTGVWKDQASLVSGFASKLSAPKATSDHAPSAYINNALEVEYYNNNAIITTSQDDTIKYRLRIGSSGVDVGTPNGTVWEYSTLLSSTNYKNYTVDKTGTGASGTWGISVSGKAATAGKADSATYATSAGKADSATKATNADEATHATSADTATKATSATNATSALEAAKLATPRTINGVTFDGTSNITISDAARVLRSGDTMTGALNFKASTMNKIGSNAQFGDDGTKGNIAIKGVGADTGVKFVSQSDDTQSGQIIYNSELKCFDFVFS